MSVDETIEKGSYGLPAGVWRWAALGFVFLALVAAGVALGAPAASRWVGLLLFTSIGVLALLLLYAVWPRASLATEDARRIAEAATRATVAWAVTGEDGALLDCNDTYRRMAGVGDGEAAPPPELALRGDASAATLYRLTRSAASGHASEEVFALQPGIEIAAAVRPMSGKRAAWWFAPRVSADAQRRDSPAQDAPTKDPAPPSASVFADAPIGIAFADPDARLSDVNADF